MDSKFYKEWFAGFASGLEALNEEEQGKMLQPCARRCADTGVLNLYKNLYEKVNHNRDDFYLSMQTLGGCRGEVVIPGIEYYVIFPECSCDLHTTGGVNSPALCECSRQSIIYVGENLWGKNCCEVTRVKTILDGGNECRFLVHFAARTPRRS